VARAVTRTLKLAYVGDASSLTKANREAESGLEKLGAGFTKFAKFAAGAALAAGAGLVAFGKKAVDSAAEAEAAQSRLATILRTTGMATEAQIDALAKQAVALEKVGVASSSNITVLQAQLATFDLTADTIETLTPAITDYVIAEKGAAASAGDFQSAANGLAQALQGNFASLTRTGFVLDDVTKELITNGTEAERAAALVDVLNSTYEGFNETARTTTEGGLQALRNSFGRLTETIGTALLPVFNTFVDAAGNVASRLEALWEIHGPRVIERFEGIVERSREIGTQFRERLPIAISAAQEMFDGLGEAIGNLGKAFATFIGQVGEELKERGAFARIRESLRDTRTSVIELSRSFTDLFNSLSSQETEKAASGFAALLDLYFDRPIGKVIDSFNKLLDLIAEVSRRLTDLSDFFRGKGQLSLPGGDFFIPDNFVPGQVFQNANDIPRPGSQQTNITVNTGIGDPAAIAREITRVIENEAGRAGSLANSRQFIGSL